MEIGNNNSYLNKLAASQGVNPGSLQGPQQPHSFLGLTQRTSEPLGPSQAAVASLSEKYGTANPMPKIQNTDPRNSVLPTGALGNDALYVKNGRAGGTFNTFM